MITSFAYVITTGLLILLILKKCSWLLHNSASNIDFSAAELANEIFYHCLPCLVEKKHAKAQKSV
ncbi:hypothetical protein, partial [Spirosoma pulveris]